MKTIIRIVSCTGGSILIVFLLYIFSTNGKQNNFKRNFPPTVLTDKTIIDLKFNSYYLAGGKGSQIYLGNLTAPLHVVGLNTINGDTTHINLSIESIDRYNFKSIQVKIDSPNFYLVDGIVPVIFKGDINKRRGKRIPHDEAFFTKCLPIGPSSFVIRTLSSVTHENVLGKQQATSPYVRLFDGLLEKQIDGIFCTDGMLHFNKHRNEILYLYHYRNEYIKIDTNLVVLGKGRTIDRTAKAFLRVDTIKSNETITLSGPPYLVNKRSAVDRNLLFVNSGLMASNEIRESFNRAAVIDVYNLKENQYMFSFYVFDHNETKMKDFSVCGNKLVALFDYYAIIYNIDYSI